MVRAGYKERDMSKTNDTSKLRIEDVEAFTLDLGGDATCTVRELRDDELQRVSGGFSMHFAKYYF
jgi:hypothetical protein